MRFGLMALCLAGLLSSTACDRGGVSTREVERAAVEHARERLGLGRDVPLKATVWTGREADGELTYCGSVESANGDEASIAPQQFAAHGDPLNFFIFGEAHQLDPPAQPGMFENS